MSDEKRAETKPMLVHLLREVNSEQAPYARRPDRGFDS